MFEENRGSANWEAAKQFVIGKLMKIPRGTKKAQNTFQHAIAAAAGFEVMAGTIPDANLQMHADEKYKLNMEAYNRHTTLLFSTVLRPFRDIIPEWLTTKLLLHKDTQCKKPYANSHKSLWAFFMLGKREVCRDYLPIYNDIVKAGTGSGTAWLEKLERLRQILYNIELRKRQNNKVFVLLSYCVAISNYLLMSLNTNFCLMCSMQKTNADTDKNDDQNDKNDDDEADEDEENEDDNEGTQEETSIPNSSTEKTAPDNYVPVHLLAFVLLGPPSDEPAPAWKSFGGAALKSSPNVPVTPSTPATPAPGIESPGAPAFTLGSKGHLSRGELKKLQDEHNRQRAGDKSGDLISKRPRHEEAAAIAVIRMNVSMEKQVALNEEKVALYKRKQRLKELERSIELGQELGFPEEEITLFKRELFTLMRSSADVDKAVAEKTAVQGELCCCGCNNNVAESIHFCTKTNRRMMAFCAASGGEEGYASKSLCRTCKLKE